MNLFYFNIYRVDVKNEMFCKNKEDVFYKRRKDGTPKDDAFKILSPRRTSNSYLAFGFRLFSQA
jgi:hypothetical protein